MQRQSRLLLRHISHRFASVFVSQFRPSLTRRPWRRSYAWPENLPTTAWLQVGPHNRSRRC